MEGRRSSPLGLYTLGIAALFLAGFLMLVVFGANTYRDVASNQTRDNEARGLLSYLATALKSGDRAGNVTVKDSDYGAVLLLVGDGSGYALHIYQYEGQLLEEYRYGLDPNAEGTTLDPKNANVLGETEIFLVERPSEDVLKLTTDEGSVLLYMRSGVSK